MAFVCPLEYGSINYAEANAVLLGLKCCKKNGFDQVILECDSLMIIEMLKDKLKFIMALTVDN